MTQVGTLSDGQKFSVEDLLYLFDHDPNGIVYLDSQGNIIDSNQAFRDMLGLGIDDKRDIAIFDLMSPESATLQAGSLSQYLEGGIREEEILFKRLDGVEVPVSGRWLPLADNGNEQGRIVLFVRDLSEKHKILTQIDYHHSLEQVLSQISRHLIHTDNADYSEILNELGTAIGVDRAYIFELNENGTMDNTLEWCGDGTPKQIQNLQGLQSSSFPWWMDILRAKGNVVIDDVDDLPPEAAGEKAILQEQQIQSLVSVPIFLDEHTLFGFIGFDDTKRKRSWKDYEIRILQMAAEIISGDVDRRKTEKLLDRERRQLLSLFDSITEAIYVVDPESYRLIYCNRHLRELIGHDPTGKLCYQEFQDYNSPCHFCPNRLAMIRKGEPYRWEMRNNKLDRDYLVTSRMIKWPDGRDVCFELAIDISRRKKGERERSRLEDQLRQAQKMEAIGTLAGGIAHDFNNILGVIMGHTELALHEIHDTRFAVENLHQVINAAHRAEEMVKQILAFSRKEESVQRPMVLANIVRESMSLLRYTLPSSIDINLDVPQDMKPVMGNSTQITQVLMNLCTNAAHAMRDSGGSLEISVREVDLGISDIGIQELPPGRYQCLAVRDTGHGMSQEIQNRVFEPYFTTKKSGEGTGMGLAVVHGIVKSHHGLIKVTSRHGEGAEFCVYFPAIKIVDANQTQEALKQLAGQKGQNERILFVDDEQSLAEIGKKMLEMLGYSVDSRTSSVEALACFQENPARFDLVITDMTMPNMTGLQLAKKIRALRPRIPIIICTGFSENINEDNFRSLGIDGYVMKPIIMKKIAEVIQDVLKQRAYIDNNRIYSDN